MAQLDYSTAVTTLAGEDGDLSSYKGKVLLIVNTASRCGLTPQYEGLEALYQSYKDQGLEILGFPCNQFGRQEPGTASDIAEFCQINYGVSFPMHAKIEVNGADTHPLYVQLKAAKPGVLGTEGIKWNFTKFLVARDGTIVARFGPRQEPATLAGDIEAQLRG
ncbi:MAG: glutathione peroxidase [Alphaproteobacteria bacterium]|nr:glutathione peroxidase [Alphaproteobacteria bacterium]